MRIQWIKPRLLDYVDRFITNFVHLKFKKKKKLSSGEFKTTLEGKLFGTAAHTSALPTSEKHIHNKTGARRRPDLKQPVYINKGSAV